MRRFEIILTDDDDNVVFHHRDSWFEAWAPVLGAVLALLSCLAKWFGWPDLAGFFVIGAVLAAAAFFISSVILVVRAAKACLRF
jgi:hypothetical protein